MQYYAQNTGIPMTNTPTIDENPEICSNTTTVSTPPGVHELDLIQLKNAYSRLLGPMTAQVGWFFEELLTYGMEIDVIIDAIDQTGWARRPSPQYLRAILRRYKANGIRTMQQVVNNRSEFDEARDERREWWE